MSIDSERGASRPLPTARLPRELLPRLVIRGLAVVAVANLVFLALVALAPGDSGLIASRVRTGYETGELGTISYLRFDTRRGYFQHNDCLVLEMLSNQHSSRLERGLAPKVYVKPDDRKPDDHNPCVLLRALVVERVDPTTLVLADRNTRYWLGYNALTGLALRWMEVGSFRRVLAGGVWIAIGALAVASVRSGPFTRRTGLAIALAAAAFWGIQYFAPGLSQGPGDALLLLGLAGIAAFPKLAARFETIVPYAAGFGAVVVFFEVFTGQLPTAFAWLAALTLAAARDQEQSGGVAARRAVLPAVAAFAAGAALTLLLKQIFALALVGTGATASFFYHLNAWMKNPVSPGRWPGPVVALYSLIRQSSTLTFGNRVAGYALMVATGLAWLAVVVRAWRRQGGYLRDVLVLIGGALVPVVWAFLLPRHTAVHAWLMVRMLVLPVSLAAVALCWPAEGAIRRVA